VGLYKRDMGGGAAKAVWKKSKQNQIFSSDGFPNSTVNMKNSAFNFPHKKFNILL
jgi:hypothetical protein